ncbi:MFS transporter [Pararobbsia alpina]|uniref:Putative glucarate transporter n=1 Tax=Pararobbsia alpina TaxID=621374 RepID=A0A6S7AZ76_9BURK|nr:MFS transporter [Pararobbsia alpina]CAB3782756.1 putative glucarate transporter [Pararobbsia alpina]
MVVGKRHVVYLAMFIMNMVNYADRINLSMGAASIADTFRLTPVQMGYMFSSFLWTYLLCVLPAGVVADRFGARNVTAAALTIWSVGSLLSGGASTFVQLLGSRLILGIGEAASYPVGGRIIRDWAPRAERGLAAAILNAGAYAGPALGGIMVGWLITTMGWRGSFVVTGGFGVVLGILWWLLYRTPEQARWISKEERALLRPNDAVAPRKTVDRVDAKQGLQTFKALLVSKTMWGLALAQGCAGYTLYLFLTWLPAYLERDRGVSILKSGIFMAGPYICACVFGIVLGWLSDALLTEESRKRGARRNLISVMLLVAAVVLFIPMVKSTVVIIAIVAVALTCVSTAMSMNIALTTDLLRGSSSEGLAVATLIFGGNVFGLAAPIATGYAVSFSGNFSVAFMIAGVLLLVGALICILLTRSPISTSGAAFQSNVAGHLPANAE